MDEKFDPYNKKHDAFMRLMFVGETCTRAAANAYGSNNHPTAKRNGTRQRRRMRPIFDRVFRQACLTPERVDELLGEALRAQKPVIRRDGRGNSEVSLEADYVARLTAFDIGARFLGAEVDGGIDVGDVLAEIHDGGCDWILLRLLNEFVALVQDGRVPGWCLAQDGCTLETLSRNSRLRFEDRAGDANDASLGASGPKMGWRAGCASPACPPGATGSRIA